MAIKVHDDAYPDAVLPDVIPIRFGQDQLRGGYALSRQLWLRDVDHQRFIALINDARRSGTLNGEQRVVFKDMRAAYKQLNFASLTMDIRHRFPRYLRWVTGMMGHLQDALKYGDPAMVKRHALAMRVLFTRPSLARIYAIVDEFQPSTMERLAEFERHEIGKLRAGLSPEQIVGSQFHDMRKVISRQVAIMDCMQILHPAPDVLASLHCLSTINGLMGGYHDGLVERQINGTQDYKRDPFTIPQDIRTRLEALVAAYPV